VPAKDICRPKRYFPAAGFKHLLMLCHYRQCISILKIETVIARLNSMLKEKRGRREGLTTGSFFDAFQNHSVKEYYCLTGATRRICSLSPSPSIMISIWVLYHCASSLSLIKSFSIKAMKFTTQWKIKVIYGDNNYNFYSH
jgi:hypothetical protein